MKVLANFQTQCWPITLPQLLGLAMRVIGG